jgi:hypothetical protein
MPLMLRKSATNITTLLFISSPSDPIILLKNHTIVQEKVMSNAESRLPVPIAGLIKDKFEKSTETIVG